MHWFAKVYGVLMFAGTDEEVRALVKTRIKYNEFFTGAKGNARVGWT